MMTSFKKLLGIVFSLTISNLFSYEMIPVSSIYTSDQDAWIYYNTPSVGPLTVSYPLTPENIVIPITGESVDLSSHSSIIINAECIVDLTRSWDYSVHSKGSGESIKALLEKYHTTVLFFGYRYGKIHPLYRHAATLRDPKNLASLGFFYLQHNAVTNHVRALPFTCEQNSYFFNNLFSFPGNLSLSDRLKAIQNLSAVFIPHIPEPLTLIPQEASSDSYLSLSISSSSPELSANPIYQGSSSAIPFQEVSQAVTPSDCTRTSKVSSTLLDSAKTPVLLEPKTEILLDSTPSSTISRSTYADIAATCSNPSDSSDKLLHQDSFDTRLVNPQHRSSDTPQSSTSSNVQNTIVTVKKSSHVKCIPPHTNPHGFNVNFFNTPEITASDIFKTTADHTKDSPSSTIKTNKKKDKKKQPLYVATAFSEKDDHHLEKLFQQSTVRQISDTLHKVNSASSVYNVFYIIANLIKHSKSVSSEIFTQKYFFPSLSLQKELSDNTQRYKIMFDDPDSFTNYRFVLASTLGFIQSITKDRTLSKSFKDYLKPADKQEISHHEKLLQEFLEHSKKACEDNPEECKRILSDKSSLIYTKPTPVVIATFLTNYASMFTYHNINSLLQVPISTGNSEGEKEIRDLFNSLIIRLQKEERNVIEEQQRKTYMHSPTSSTIAKLYNSCLPDSLQYATCKPHLGTVLLLLRSLKKGVGHLDDSAHLNHFFNNVLKCLLESSIFNTEHDLSNTEKFHRYLTDYFHKCLQNTANKEEHTKQVKKYIKKIKETSNKQELESLSNMWDYFSIVCSEYLPSDQARDVIMHTAQTLYENLSEIRDGSLADTVQILKLSCCNQSSHNKIIKNIHTKLVTIFNNPEITYQEKNMYLLNFMHHVRTLTNTPLTEYHRWIEKLALDTLSTEDEIHNHNTLKIIENSCGNLFEVISLFMIEMLRQKIDKQLWRQNYNTTYDLLYDKFIFDTRYHDLKIQELWEIIKNNNSENTYIQSTNIITMIASFFSYISSFKNTFTLPSSSTFTDKDEALNNSIKNIKKIFTALPIEIQNVALMTNPILSETFESI